jgi:hypothetical protein
MKQIKIRNLSITITPYRVFLIIIFIFLLISMFLRAITPKNPVGQQNQQPALPQPIGLGQVTTDFTITINTPLPKLDSKVKLYRASGTIEPAALAQTFANKLGLINVPKRESMWYQPDTSRSLIYSQYAKTITFSQEASAEESPLDRERAIQAADTFVKQYLGVENLTPDLASLTFSDYEHDADYHEESEGNTMLRVPFMQKIEDYPLAMNTNNSRAVFVWVGPGYTIVKATTTGVIPSFEETEELPTLSEKEITDMVVAHRGTIVSLIGNNPSVPAGKISNVRLNEADLEYRSLDEDGLIYPFIKFVGVANMESGEIAKIQIIHPVVRITVN